jgi:hypothetical protein
MPLAISNLPSGAEAQDYPGLFAARLNRLRKKPEWMAKTLKNIHSIAFTARLKSCPDTNRLNFEFFRSL